MLSRVATAVYVIGRRLERADHVARVTAVHQEIALEGPGSSPAFWAQLAASTGLGVTAAGADARRRVTAAAVAEIASSLDAAFQAGRAVRPSIPSEVFEQINQLHGRMREEAEPAAHRSLRAVQLGVHLATGLVDDVMAHGPEREFLRIGRHLERVGNVTRLVARRAAAAPAPRPDANDWAAVLRCVWSLEAYRVRGHRRPVDFEGAARALLYDPGLPRGARLAADRVVGISRDLGSRHDRVAREADRLARLFRHPVELSSERLAELEEATLAGVAAVEMALRAAYFMPTHIRQSLDVADQQQ